VLPLKDENPTEFPAYVTMALVAANVLVWLGVQGAGAPQALESSVVYYGSYPCEITGACRAAGLGWRSVFTSMFMHGSWEHIIGNMLFLWVFGNNIEDSMGHLRFLVFYLLCGVAAAAAHVFLSPLSQVPAVGASGAISGIMGAYVVLYPRARVHTWVPPFFVFRLPAFVLLGYWFLIQLLSGVVSYGPQAAEEGGVAVWAHVGGFVAGVLLVGFFRKPRLVEARRRGERLPPDEVARLEW
jgi:membrane associated rhomboid family serine protease